jgi:hypothetical protein
MEWRGFMYMDVYRMVFTEHARARMAKRDISKEDVVHILRKNSLYAYKGKRAGKRRGNLEPIS